MMPTLIYGVAHTDPKATSGVSTPAGTHESTVAANAGQAMSSRLLRYGWRPIVYRGNLYSQIRRADRLAGACDHGIEPQAHVAMQVHMNAPGLKWDAWARRKWRGTTVFYAGDERAQALAEALLANLTGLIEQEGERHRVRKIPAKGFRIRWCERVTPPAILIELGHAPTDPTFAKWIDELTNQYAVGECIADTLNKWEQDHEQVRSD